MLSQKRGSWLTRALCAKAVFVLGIAAAVLVSAIAANAEIIYPRAVYVDLAHGSTAAYQTGTNWANVRNGGGTTSNLIDINGIATEIDVTVSNSGGSSFGFSASVGLMPNLGTDAYNLFNGYVNGQGVTNLTSGTIILTFSGLDPSLRYDFAIFGNRIDDNTVTANERFVLIGADSFSNISSTGKWTTTVQDDTTYFDTRANTVNGYIARWDSIAPGLDGSFTVEARSNSGVVLYLNAARLEIIPEPSSLLLLATGLLGLLCLRRRRGKE